MRIALDLDHTLYPLGEVMAALTGDQRLVAHELRTYECMARLCGSPQRLRRLFAQAWRYDTQCRVGLYPGAHDTLRTLDAHGVELHVMTARHEAAARDTQRFLDTLGVSLASFHCALDLDKVALCERLGVGVLVDDHPGTLAKADDAGLVALTLRWPYNAAVIDERSIEHAHDWARLGPMVTAAALGARLAV